MLSDLEAQLAAALRKALPQDATVSIGPRAKPETSVNREVNVCALGFHTSAPETEDREGKRESAFLCQRYELSGDGKTLDFPLPTDARGELAEIEIAPGRLARPGDQCWLEGRILRFYRPPTGPFTILLRGDRALGYRETVKGSASLVLTVLDDGAATVDELTSIALGVLLSTFVDLDFLLLAQARPSGFRLRLLKPQAELQSVVRDAVDVGTTRLLRSTVQIVLRGDLEITLVAGVVEDEHGRIERVEGKLDVASGKRPSRLFTVATKGDQV
jgi:hypothetical protein